MPKWIEELRRDSTEWQKVTLAQEEWLITNIQEKRIPLHVIEAVVNSFIDKEDKYTGKAPHRRILNWMMRDMGRQQAQEPANRYSADAAWMRSA